MRASNFRFGVEPLERRTLLSLSLVGPEFLVNTFTPGQQHRPAIAMDGDGDFVIAWQSRDQEPGGGYGIYAQRNNAGGAPLGGEFHVNTYTTNDQTNPAIAIDADGDFVIVWNSLSQDGHGLGVYAQRYNAVGAAQGGEFRVNTTTTNDQSHPTVAMDVAGNVVVAWDTFGQDGSGQAIYAQRYNFAGVAQGGEFRVNTRTANDQTFPTVAASAVGGFVIAWQDFYPGPNDPAGDGFEIMAQRYDAAGVAQGGEFRVNTYTTQNQMQPTVAMDASGDFVFAWESFGQDGEFLGVYARRYNAAGVAQGGEFRVNTATPQSQFAPSIAIDASGDFVVVWQGQDQDGSGSGVYRQSFSAAGAKIGSEVRVNSFTINNQRLPAVAMDAEGDFTVTWVSYLQDGSFDGVYAQRYDESPDTAGPMIGGVFINDRRVLPYTVQSAPVAALVVSFSENLSTAGGATGANSVLNPANWQLTRNGVELTGLIDSISFGSAPLTGRYEAQLTLGASFTSGNLTLIARDAIRDLAGNALDGNLDGAAGGSAALAFPVSEMGAQGPEIRVNSFTTNHQREASVATDAAGNFVVAWQSHGQDGSAPASFGIFAQRYDSVGVPLGSEFRVSTSTGGDQSFPSAAMDADGDFVIVWDGTGSGDSQGIFARRYTAAGVPTGAEFRVNTTISFDQIQPAVTMNAVGDFVVAWGSVPVLATGYNVRAQRFSAAGVAQGSELLVFSGSTGFVPAPDVAMGSDGNFVVTWQAPHPTNPNPSNRIEVLGQRYTAAGLPQFGWFWVNDFEFGNNRNPSVAMDADGDFVVAWEASGGGSGGNYQIYARRFAASGSLEGSFRVSNSEWLERRAASVAMKPDGEFVVAWESGRDFEENIHARRYDAAGQPHGMEFRVDGATGLNYHRGASVALDPTGDFVVASHGYGRDGSGAGIYAQRYSKGDAPVVAALADGPDPVSGGNVITLTASDVIDDQTVVSVRFHRESNGVEGLQFGAGGDVLLGTDSNGGNGWAVAVSTVGLSGGTYTYYAQAVDDEGFAGAPASTTNTIVAGAAAVVASQFHFATLPQRLTFTFNQNVSASLALADIIVQTLPGGPVIMPGGLTYDTATNTATVTLPGVLPDASYRATVLAAGISGPGGTMQTNHVLNFSFLRGDANGDGRVNLTDFNALAANFGQEPRDFTQGDFNYDGRVNLADFNILASRFGSSLPASLEARGGSPFVGMPVSEEDRDDLLEQLTGSTG